jgi:hypothetical protein
VMSVPPTRWGMFEKKGQEVVFENGERPVGRRKKIAGEREGVKKGKRAHQEGREHGVRARLTTWGGGFRQRAQRMHPTPTAMSASPTRLYSHPISRAYLYERMSGG